MIETFITKYLLEFAIVFFVGVITKFLTLKLGEDRSNTIQNAILTAMLWAENEYGIGNGQKKWEQAWSKIIAILKGQKITLKKYEISYVQDIMKATVPEINEIIYNAAPEAVKNARNLRNLHEKY